MSTLEMRLTALAEARVAGGMAWLKENVPGGIEKINLATLDIADDECCAMAQATESTWGNSAKRFGIFGANAEDLGFVVLNAMPKGVLTDWGRMQYGYLTDAWHQAITCYRQANAQAAFADAA